MAKDETSVSDRTMNRENDMDNMVTIVSCRLRGGAHIEIRVPAEDETWLRAIFTRDANPFRVLRDVGFEACLAPVR